MNSTLICALAAAIFAWYPTSATAAEDESYIASFSCDHGAFALRLPKTYQELRKLGKLRSDTVLDTEQWEGYKTIRRELDFGTLSMTVITFTNEPSRYMIGGLEVTSREWAVTGPFRVGDSFASALKLLGQKQSPETARKDYGSEGGDVRFEVQQRKITKVTYECYTG